MIVKLNFRFYVFVPSIVCISVSGQTGLHEVVGEWHSEWLQRKQGQNWTILAAYWESLRGPITDMRRHDGGSDTLMFLTTC